MLSAPLLQYDLLDGAPAPPPGVLDHAVELADDADLRPHEVDSPQQLPPLIEDLDLQTRRMLTQTVTQILAGM